ncbi:DUF4178 domain-containing protein [Chryseolinea lacunae]|uniref:DUF4178 domain-containing protein n=1 Tax=Chryseolinea lacunae TaxID=2801331 RepID=A0ABS1KRD6_9BACT|nr:DUF4178 domain-containing protein [Chryseolinea lacunae]MBL0742030.1 DUF4178 domain-containing protein [Chryseolinea lacunae]
MSGSSYTIACPKCQTVNTVRGKAMTLALTCSSCKTYFGVGKWSKDLTTFGTSYEPVLPIGAKGKIDGKVYEVMGLVVKKEQKYKYDWREYIIFNPFEGYAFLSEYNGHWNMVWPVDDVPPLAMSASDFVDEGFHFRLFQKYKAKVIYAVGEFFFDVVHITETTFNREFIAPPLLFALEKSDDSVLWCKGEYMTPSEVASAFQIPVSKLPSKTGMGYTQPMMGKIKNGAVVSFSILVFIFLLIAQMFFSGSAEEKVVYQGNFFQADLKDQKFFKTSSFTLEGGSKSLEVVVVAPLLNDWFFAEFSLIDETTGTETIFTKDVEYYQGYEDGESWSEGSTKGEAFLSQIPAGKYHINIYPEFSTSSHEFSLTVKRDVAAWSNFWLTLLMLSVFPIGYFIRRNWMEKKRWSESDYSPYEY